jgi:CRISPR/Cas system type I-B associated protein Csh2 (Cas7 group RAMP superfamily)
MKAKVGGQKTVVENKGVGTMSENGKEKVERKVTGMLVFEVVNSNPNGSPDGDGVPRQFPDGIGIVSDVSAKRKVRDLVAAKDGVWKELANGFNPPLKDDEFCILESNDKGFVDGFVDGIGWKQVCNMTREQIMARYFDARVFGCTHLAKGQAKAEEVVPVADGDQPEAPTAKVEPPKGKEKAKAKAEPAKVNCNCVSVGPVQFGLGVSIAPVYIETETNTKKCGVEEDKDRGMAPQGTKVVRHGLYVMPFWVTPQQALNSGTTKDDIELIKKLLPLIFQETRSRSRPEINIIHAWWMEHKDKKGSCDWKMRNALKPKKLSDPMSPSIDIGEYDIPSDLPQELKAKLESFCDLMD